MIRVEHTRGAVRYVADVSDEGDTGRNVIVYARCAACGKHLLPPLLDHVRLTRYSTRLRRLVGWRPSRAWPAAVRDALSRAIRREVERGNATKARVASSTENS